MAVTEDILVRLRIQGQQQYATAMGGAATQTGRLGTAAQTTGKQVEGAGKKAGKAKTAMAGWAKGMGGALAATAGLAVAQKVFRDTITNATDLGEQINKTAVVFRGPGANAIHEWSKTTATALGISRAQALESAGVLGNMLVPMGIARTKAARLSKGMVNLAGDMASFNNATPEETLDALRAGLAGETEPLRRFGVFLNEARIQQEAVNMGLYKGKGPLDAQAKALATHAIILKDTKDAQGDFARTSGGLANQQRILKAQYADITAQVGTALLPVLRVLAKVLIFLLKHFRITGRVLLYLISPMAAFVSVVVLAYRKVGVFRAAVDFLWSALKKSPIAWVIRNFDTLVRAVAALPGKLKTAASGMWDFLKDTFKSALNAVIGWWNDFEVSVDVPDLLPGPDRITIGTPNIPALAAGGPALAGRAHLVGEQGPELFVPGASGTVYPSGGVIHTHVYLRDREIATAVGQITSDRMARR